MADNNTAENRDKIIVRTSIIGILANLFLASFKAVIESEMGRTMKSVDGEYQDRIIDIDILMIDDLVIDEPDFKVPHPLMEEREFVMKPLKEILK